MKFRRCREIAALPECSTSSDESQQMNRLNNGLVVFERDQNGAVQADNSGRGSSTETMSA